MKKIFLLTWIAVSLVSAQTIDLHQIESKTDEYKQARQYDKGIKYLQGILKKNQYYGQVWDILTEFYMLKYKTSQSNTIYITTKDLKNPKKMLEKLTDQAFNTDKIKMIYTARYGSACGYNSTLCEMIIRNELVDHPVDTVVPDKAKEYFDKAEKEFMNRNLEKAITNYKKAIEYYPNYYKANLYLGDTYYALKDYKSAIEYFKMSIEAQPDLLEPRKYLVDAYMHSGAYEPALTACIEGMMVFPDWSMMVKLESIHTELGNKFQILRIIRTILPKPDGLNSKSIKEVMNVKTEKGSIWLVYKEGLEKFKKEFNNEEIVYDKEGVPLLYQEVEAWRYMHKNSTSKALEKIKKLEEDGYFDCFVMIDNFHYDFYDQYKVWVEHNKERMITYLSKYRAQY